MILLYVHPRLLCRNGHPFVKRRHRFIPGTLHGSCFRTLESARKLAACDHERKSCDTGSWCFWKRSRPQTFGYLFSCLGSVRCFPEKLDTCSLINASVPSSVCRQQPVVASTFNRKASHMHTSTVPTTMLLFCMRNSPNQFLEATMQNWWFDGCCPYLVFSNPAWPAACKILLPNKSPAALDKTAMDRCMESGVDPLGVSLEKQTNPRGSFPSNK